MIRAIIQQAIEGVLKRFTASGRSNETFTDREYLQHYGFTSLPLSGAEGIIIKEGNHIVMIASDDRRYRISLKEGEAALYDDLGQKVHLTRSGIEAASPLKITASAPLVEISGTESITMNAPLVTINAAAIVMGGEGGEAELIGDFTMTGNISVTGNIAASGTIIDGGGNTNHHSH